MKSEKSKWIPVDGFNGYAKIFRCENCGLEIEVNDWTTAKFVDMKVCPNCRAEMDGENNE